MQFCTSNTPWTDVWLDHGINRCFFESLSSGFLCSFIFCCGIIQHFMYSRYSTRVDPKLIPSSHAFRLQISLTLLMIIEAVTHMILQNIDLYDKVLYGYHVLAACAFTAAYLVTLRLIFLERSRVLPSIPTRGHGLLLILFWGLAFVRENLAFVSWFSSGWWWSLKS